MTFLSRADAGHFHVQGYSGGNEQAAPHLEQAVRELLRAGFESVDYVELRDAESLVPLDRAHRPGRLLAAARLGKARLIDNVAVP